VRIRRLAANIVRAAYMAHLLIPLPRWLEIYDYGLRNGVRFARQPPRGPKKDGNSEV